MHKSSLFPAISDDGIRSRIAFAFLFIVALISTARSLIHMFAPDGGANSIAGLAVDVEGGANLIAIFAQWGASQLLLAFFYWLAILKYRSLVPLMLLMVVIEQLLRIAVGLLKPVVAGSTPPGTIGSLIVLPLALVALLLTLRGEPENA
ncbi:MAG TPA: hypothetical protein G4O08_06105 [Anaerolineae bacterium]|nr:hypothetical protein [Anaerolineae bacterium]